MYVLIKKATNKIYVVLITSLQVMLTLRYLLIFLYFEIFFMYVNNYKDNKILSRRKRYLMFPEGSNFIVSIYYFICSLPEFNNGKNFIVPYNLFCDRYF